MSLRRILMEGWDLCIYLGRRHGFGYLWRWGILALDKGSIATRHFGFLENGVSTCRPQQKVPSFQLDSFKPQWSHGLRRHVFSITAYIILPILSGMPC